MGGSQSNRKMTVDNENPINVSQEVLDRVQSQLASKPAPTQQTRYEPPPQYYEPPKKQSEFAAEEAYWQRRVEALKRAHDKINQTMQLEYQKTLKEANQLYEMAHDDSIAGVLPPCQEEKAKVLQCYTENPNKSLLCSVLVNEFNDCVCKSRVAAVSAS